jgi:flagellar protein FliT
VNASDTETLLSAYDALSATTGRMLTAARSGDWDRLVSLEQDCASLVASLASLEADDPLPMTLRERKAALIRKVLADDAAIRDITEPYMKRLESMLGANRCEQRLLGTYGPSLGA